jgi:hypothetical protein
VGVRRQLTISILLAAATSCGRTAIEPRTDDGGVPGRDAFVPGGPDATPADAGPASCDRPDRTLVFDSSDTNVDLSALLPNLAAGEVIRVEIDEGVRIDSASATEPAFTTGELPRDVEVCLVVQGEIVGRGGSGGSGGTGVTGLASRPCGRDGQRGGDAVEFRTAGLVLVEAPGLIAGGGGGGGGAAGCDRNAGGGGGAGAPPGAGGEGSSGLEREPEVAFCRDYGGVLTGAAGDPGAEGAGGDGGLSGRGPSRAAGGRGGALGRPGEPGRACFGAPGGDGGRGGFAIVLGSRPVEIDGDGRIEGAVDF